MEVNDGEAANDCSRMPISMVQTCPGISAILLSTTPTIGHETMSSDTTVEHGVLCVDPKSRPTTGSKWTFYNKLSRQSSDLRAGGTRARTTFDHFAATDISGSKGILTMSTNRQVIGEEQMRVQTDLGDKGLSKDGKRVIIVRKTLRTGKTVSKQRGRQLPVVQKKLKSSAEHINVNDALVKVGSEVMKVHKERLNTSENGKPHRVEFRPELKEQEEGEFEDSSLDETWETGTSFLPCFNHPPLDPSSIDKTTSAELDCAEADAGFKSKRPSLPSNIWSLSSEEVKESGADEEKTDPIRCSTLGSIKCIRSNNPTEVKLHRRLVEGGEPSKSSPRSMHGVSKKRKKQTARPPSAERPKRNVVSMKTEIELARASCQNEGVLITSNGLTSVHAPRKLASSPTYVASVGIRKRGKRPCNTLVMKKAKTEYLAPLPSLQAPRKLASAPTCVAPVGIRKRGKRPGNILVSKEAKTNDFLTFLCMRGENGAVVPSLQDFLHGLQTFREIQPTVFENHVRGVDHCQRGITTNGDKTERQEDHAAAGAETECNQVDEEEDMNTDIDDNNESVHLDIAISNIFPDETEYEVNKMGALGIGGDKCVAVNHEESSTAVEIECVGKEAVTAEDSEEQDAASFDPYYCAVCGVHCYSYQVVSYYVMSRCTSDYLYMYMTI